MEARPYPLPPTAATGSAPSPDNGLFWAGRVGEVGSSRRVPQSSVFPSRWNVHTGGSVIIYIARFCSTTLQLHGDSNAVRGERLQQAAVTAAASPSPALQKPNDGPIVVAPIGLGIGNMYPMPLCSPPVAMVGLLPGRLWGGCFRWGWSSEQKAASRHSRSEQDVAIPIRCMPKQHELTSARGSGSES